MPRTKEAPFDAQDCQIIQQVISGTAETCEIPRHLITAGFVDCRPRMPPRLSPEFAAWVEQDGEDLLTSMYRFWKHGR